ncbi:DUF3649 domain-containing protein [Cupriavidus metallidurans]|uniref:DUF3649 domain-containing protein n=2 Tax=Cupriavidus metallidurans TaxID=119219 RepID=A0A132HJ05_9BURK|nr:MULTISPECIES: DUF3649 domain-containing protein [Cupriavidus]KWR82726.1 iron transporter [Cupriavidus sp. SHE]KWW36798.1 hypothetical protein AU374_02859 [Cupriavidus metallidurans]QBP09275.1 DUF3649 domain-containing protein [Cupriavidus metallidurans]QWC89688.1 DUF3649 domain-containing protein [Cupriavidus metallidurans]
MKQRVSVGYRMAIGSRVIAAVVGGYAVAALCTGCLSLALVRWTDVARSEAVMTATLMSFLWFALAVIWVFAASTAWRAWIGLCVPGVLMAAGWSILRGA